MTKVYSPYGAFFDIVNRKAFDYVFTPEEVATGDWAKMLNIPPTFSLDDIRHYHNRDEVMNIHSVVSIEIAPGEGRTSVYIFNRNVALTLKMLGYTLIKTPGVTSSQFRSPMPKLKSKRYNSPTTTHYPRTRTRIVNQ